MTPIFQATIEHNKLKLDSPLDFSTYLLNLEGKRVSSSNRTMPKNPRQKIKVTTPAKRLPGKS